MTTRRRDLRISSRVNVVMRGLAGQARLLRIAMASVGFCCVLGVSAAQAEDGGFFGFLRSLGGAGAAAPPAPAPAPMPDAAAPRLRPLTVRRAKIRPAMQKSHVARGPSKTGPVSIYEDPTLRQGDAVMTKDGVKVFAGGRFSTEHPFTDTDFVAVTASKSVNPGLRKAVSDLNKLPRT